MSSSIPAGPRGTLILYGEDDTHVQHSLEGISATFSQSWLGHNGVTLEARLAGENFVDLSDGRSEELTLLLELWSEQRRLGASDEALATTRNRIERHIRKESA